MTFNQTCRISQTFAVSGWLVSPLSRSPEC
jgi:hypothetical protein